MRPSFNPSNGSRFSFPTLEDILQGEKAAIRRLAKVVRVGTEEIQASAWLAHQRALAEVEAADPSGFVKVFFAKLKNEFWEARGGRYSAQAFSAYTKNDDGEFCEVEFSDQDRLDDAASLAEIVEWRSRLTVGQLETLELLALGPAFIAKKFNVSPRRGQQIWRELFQKLKEELTGEGGVQSSLW